MVLLNARKHKLILSRWTCPPIRSICCVKSIHSCCSSKSSLLGHLLLLLVRDTTVEDVNSKQSVLTRGSSRAIGWQTWSYNPWLLSHTDLAVMTVLAARADLTSPSSVIVCPFFPFDHLSFVRPNHGNRLGGRPRQECLCFKVKMSYIIFGICEWTERLHEPRGAQLGCLVDGCGTGWRKEGHGTGSAALSTEDKIRIADKKRAKNSGTTRKLARMKQGVTVDCPYLLHNAFYLTDLDA